jgi:hypothetical protein
VFVFSKPVRVYPKGSCYCFEILFKEDLEALENVLNQMRNGVQMNDSEVYTPEFLAKHHYIKAHDHMGSLLNHMLIIEIRGYLRLSNSKYWPIWKLLGFQVVFDHETDL